MTVALAMRSSVGLSVLHDRAPLFVRLPDGEPAQRLHGEDRQQDARAARCSNCSTEGLTAAMLAEADEGLGPAGRLGLLVKADSVGTFRVLGQPARRAAWSMVRRRSTSCCATPQTGEQTVYHSLFMGPR